MNRWTTLGVGLIVGLAVCIGPSPAMADVVRRYGVGVTAPTFDPRGALGIWVQDGAGYFGDIRVTALGPD